jgi:hypothetical protein
MASSAVLRGRNKVAAVDAKHPEVEEDEDYIVTTVDVDDPADILLRLLSVW